MGILGRLFGSEAPRPRGATPEPTLSADQQAIARYRYMLDTAPPETIEQAHAEAFARLTPEQRRTLLQQLSPEIPQGERGAVARAADDPAALARLATRAEVRQPGALERTLGRAGGAAGAVPGLGGIFAGSLLGAVAGTVLGTVIAQNFLAHHGDAPGLDAGGEGEVVGQQASGGDGFIDASDDGGGFDAGGGIDV